MVDIKYIREHQAEFKQAITNKVIDLDLDLLLSVDEKRIGLLQQVESLNAKRNQLSEQFKTTSDKELIISEGKQIKEQLAAKEKEFDGVNQQFKELMAKVPTLPSVDTPVSHGEEGNRVIFESPKTEFDFTPKDHIQLGKELDILDLERGVKVSGYRGYYLKNQGAILVSALMFYAFQKMVQKGFTPMIVPTLVKGFALFGSGYFKGLTYNGEVDEIYQVATRDRNEQGEIEGEQKFLVGTAEPSLLAYYSGETLREEDLPIKLTGFSQCYRSEIGSYGKDTRGMYRVHEFMKVEQVILAKDDLESADKLQQDMVNISKELHEELGLPYRQLQISTGDMAAGKYKAFDIEAWMPGLNRWGETGSASNFLDWQSRRLNVRFEDKEGKKHYVYMLNNTALPSPRIFIAIVENYQQKDGSVLVPKALQALVGFEKISK